MRSGPDFCEKKTVLLLEAEGKVALWKRPEKGLLAGLYEFPWIEGKLSEAQVREKLGEELLSLKKLPAAKHIFTHKEWHMKGFMIRVDELEPKSQGKDSLDWLYIEPEETRERYPIPSAFAAYSQSLNIRLGNEKYREE